MIPILRRMLLLAALAATQAMAQTPPPSPSSPPPPPVHGCDSAQSRQFDFWVGDLDAAYAGGKSRNRVAKTLGGCVIVEQFTGSPGSPLEGTSVSTFDRATKRWKQTWVDNTAAYLDFSGGFADGRMILEREAEREGKRFRQRMVWQDIRPEAFKWLWQRSDDDGKSWSTQWEIDYTRSRK